MKSYSKYKKYKKYKKNINLLKIANNTNEYYKNLIFRQQIYIFNLNKTIEILKEKNNLDKENKERIDILEKIINSIQNLDQTGGIYQESLNIKDKINFLYDKIANLIAKQKSLVNIDKIIKDLERITINKFDIFSKNTEDILNSTYNSMLNITSKLDKLDQTAGSYYSYIYYLMNDLFIILKILKYYKSDNIKIIFEPDNIKQFIIDNFNKNKDYLKILNQLYDIYQKILNIKSIKLIIKINNFNNLENIINKLNIINNKINY